MAYGRKEWGPWGNAHVTTNRAGRRGSHWKRDRWSLLLLKEATVTAVLVAEVVVQVIQKALLTFVFIIIFRRILWTATTYKFTSGPIKMSQSGASENQATSTTNMYSKIVPQNTKSLFPRDVPDTEQCPSALQHAYADTHCAALEPKCYHTERWISGTTM